MEKVGNFTKSMFIMHVFSVSRLDWPRAQNIQLTQIFLQSLSSPVAYSHSSSPQVIIIVVDDVVDDDDDDEEVEEEEEEEEG